MSDKPREKFIELLDELFQLNQPELDFGLYRILHARAREIRRFIDEELVQEIAAAFSDRDAQTAEQKLEQARQQLIATLGETAFATGGALKPEFENVPVGKAYLDALESLHSGQGALSDEAQIYDHLLRFFSRYYDNGDFLSRRHFVAENDSRAAPYAVPYDGREVYLHWANKDQYYIKSSDYLSHYRFDLSQALRQLGSPGLELDGDTPRPVHIRLVDATPDAHNNVKEKDRRFFIVHAAEPVKLETGRRGETELVLQFEYRADPDKQGQDRTWQRHRLEQAERSILDALAGLPEAAGWLAGLKTPAPTDKQPNRTLLAKHLAQYSARQTMDFFIHKDLGGFLRRELDFYIKNEVLRLDHVDEQDATQLATTLDRIKVLRRIARKIIAFLAQVEDFQKRLWLKKKFVTETHYCITLDRIPEAFYPDIAANDRQREEWVCLCAINEIGGDAPDYSEPLSVEFLKANPHLMVDTRNFSRDFTDRLVAGIERLDDSLNGACFHSENFQALTLVRETLSRSVDCIYIDPPYNTGDSEIPYKNTYLHSSWMTMMGNRMQASSQLLCDDPVLFVAIDDFEMVNISNLIDHDLHQLQREMIIVNHHPQGGKAKLLAHTHEYMLACVGQGSDRSFSGRSSTDGVERRPFKRSGTAESNFRRRRPNSFYAILVDPDTLQVTGIEPPPKGNDLPDAKRSDGMLRVYPFSGDSDERVERVWRRSYESCLSLVRDGKLVCSEGLTIYQLIEHHERRSALFSNWVDPRYNAGTFGANLLQTIMGDANLFSYPKSLNTVSDALVAAGLESGDKVLDYFAGSGTTGHSVISISREEGTDLRYTLMEMGAHFESVLIPRLKKVVYAAEWSNGKPKARDTGISHAFKIIKLESYEDTLNNLQLSDDAARGMALEDNPALRGEYRMHYWLDVETRGSASLLNVTRFADPTAYTLKIRRPGRDEIVEQPVDLIETFNWLIGLHVELLDAPRRFNADFARERDPELPEDQNTRLKVIGRLKQAPEGRFWFRTVEGWVARTPGSDEDREKVLVVWRKLTDNPDEDAAALEAFLATREINLADTEFDLIYVNGPVGLPLPGSAKTRLASLEETFHARMWDVEGVE
jgi:adenine-specific DNA-methyltransferase